MTMYDRVCGNTSHRQFVGVIILYVFWCHLAQRQSGMVFFKVRNDLVFDPFSGVASSGVAALLHKRIFWGCELVEEYANKGKERLDQTVAGSIKYRPYDKPIYDPKTSALSKIPDEWRETNNENADI